MKNTPSNRFCRQFFTFVKLSRFSTFNVLSASALLTKAKTYPASVSPKFGLKVVYIMLPLTFVLTACEPTETKKAEMLEVDWQDLLIEKAQAGEPEAQYAMARLNCCAPDRMKNTVEWLCAAAEANMPQAFFDLGRIYSQTYPADYASSGSNTMALMFFNLAEKNGFDAPHVLHNYRHEVIGKMTNQDITYAQELVNQWPDVPCGTHKRRWSLK